MIEVIYTFAEEVGGAGIRVISFAFEYGTGVSVDIAGVGRIAVIEVAGVAAFFFY